MKTSVHALALSLLTAAVCFGILPAEATLTFHCTFDDSGSPLTPLVGGMPDVVTYTKTSAVAPVAGLGGCSLVTDSAILEGVTPGTGALTVPVGQAVRIPHGVPTDTYRPWAMAVRFYQPQITDSRKYVIFSNNESKAADSAMFIKLVNGVIQVGGGDGKAAASGWGYSNSATLTPNAWHVIAFSFQDGHIRMYIDEKLAWDKSWTLSASWGG